LRISRQLNEVAREVAVYEAGEEIDDAVDDEE
jgi:hypothetical protein